MNQEENRNPEINEAELERASGGIYGPTTMVCRYCSGKMLYYDDRYKICEKCGNKQVYGDWKSGIFPAIRM